MNISLITVTLNSEESIRLTIDSLNRQSETFEYIIIDGGSQDRTIDELNRYKGKKILISEEDDGISDAFNKGIKYANNEYILLLNAGDVLEVDSLDVYFSAIDEYPDADVFYGDLKYFSDDNTNGYIEKPNINNIWKFMSIYHPGMLVKKTAYEKIGGYNLDYKYAMDSEWIHRAIKNGLMFQNIPDVLARMGLGGKSDKYFYFSLIEFCRSSMIHGPSTIKPLYYLVRQLVVHSLLKIPLIKHWRLNKNTN